jgi:hypothetical protein
LRCIYWLNQNLVLQHANLLNLLNALRTQLSIEKTLSGADGLKKCAMLQTVVIQCVSKDGCFPEESAAKP